jgi:hypothetical protein
MGESPSCWGDSIPRFFEPLGGAPTSDRAAIRAFREGDAEAASMGPGGPLVRHPGGAGARRPARTPNAVKRKLPATRRPAAMGNGQVKAMRPECDALEIRSRRVADIPGSGWPHGKHRSLLCFSLGTGCGHDDPQRAAVRHSGCHAMKQLVRQQPVDYVSAKRRAR